MTYLIFFLSFTTALSFYFFISKKNRKVEDNPALNLSTNENKLISEIVNEPKVMTFQDDKDFINLLKKLKDYNIDINQNGINRLYESLKLYISDRNSDNSLNLSLKPFLSTNYYIDLAIRELGRKTYLPVDNIDEQLSNDIATIIFENYFINSTETISKILNEIQRISKNNFACKILSESKYDEKSGETDVTIKFNVFDRTFELVHIDEFEDGTLMQEFITDKLIPALKGSITKGHVLYIYETYISFLYFEDDNNYQKFIENINYYSEI